MFAVTQAPDRGKGLPPETEAAIRDLLGAEEALDLVGLGKIGGFTPAAFPVYIRILDDPDEDRYLVARTFVVLADPLMKADRSQFLDRAIGKLSHSHPSVRHTAVKFLAQIGGAKDTAPVVALLSDKEWETAIAAAKTLAAIGDDRTLAAMNVWLRTSGTHKDRHERVEEVLRKDVTNYRDELKQRLEKAKPPAK
jgi:hypothetical protein